MPISYKPENKLFTNKYHSQPSAITHKKSSISHVAEKNYSYNFDSSPKSLNLFIFKEIINKHLYLVKKITISFHEIIK